MNENNRLSPEDQARVDQVINSGYNMTERRPFRPLLLLLFLAIVVTMISLAAVGYAKHHGLI